MPYISVSGSPTTYDINWDAAASSAGFTPVSGATYPGGTSGNIPLTIPPTLFAGTVYNGSVTLYNASGCNSTYPFTVTINAQPSANFATVTGPSNATMCSGQVISLSISGATGAGIYTWSGPGITTTSTTTTTTTYTTSASSLSTGAYTVGLSSNIPSCNLTASKATTTIYSVAPTPTITVSTSASTICLGNSFTLSATPTGNAVLGSPTLYTWSGAAGVITNTSAGSTSPSLTPTTSVTAGVFSVAVTYSVSGCSANNTTTVNVNAVPSSTGSTNNGPICIGGTVTLSANSSNATNWSWTGPNSFSSSLQNPTTTPTISGPYSLAISNSGSGCSAGTTYTTTVTVNSIPTAGPTNNGAICRGGTVTLNANPANGANSYTWSGNHLSSTTAQSPTATATVTSTYSLTVTNTSGTSGCSPLTIYTTSVTVNLVPSSTGATSNPICIGNTATLNANSSNATSWAWTGPNGFSSTIHNATATPTVTSTYSLTLSSTGSNCNPSTVYTKTVIVNPLPSAVVASGGGTFCGSATITASNGGSGTIYFQGSASGGTSTSTPSASQSVSSSGTYYFRALSASGCWGPQGSVSVTINPLPAAISGVTNVCVGSTTSLTDAIPGGVWSSSNTLIATIGSGSTISAISTGLATITYTLGTGCSVTTTIFSSPSAAPITGSTSLCTGTSTILSDITQDGNWTSSDETIAIVSLYSGVVTGIASGTAKITYALGTGCKQTTIVSVNATSATITGNTSVCSGLTTILSDASGTGTWSSGNTAIAIIGSSSGIVSGVTPGSVYISYTLPSGCSSIWTMIVDPIPANVTVGGGGSYCGNATITAANGGDGTIYYQGTTSGGTSTATPSTSQAITSSGTYYFRALSASGCWSAEGSTTVTINTLPASITGNAILCAGSSTSLSNITAGGTWSSSNANAAIDGSGNVTGTNAGTATITYTALNSCIATTPVTVNPISNITGAAVCAGVTSALTDAITGGTWSSSNPTIATIGSNSGLVSGLIQGTATIVYTLGTGCSTTTIITVNQVPLAISGIGYVCSGSTTSLSDATASGTWSSSNTAIATIGSSTGIVTGTGSGTANITYLLSTGCKATSAVTINPLPTAISGTTNVCVGLTTAISDASGGGSWSSSSTSVATIGSTGIVTGVTAGTSVITYSLVTGCITTAIVTVNPITAITGTSPVCVGATINLNETTAGGAWSSNNNAIATVGSSTGIATGIASGTVTVTYLLPTGCRSTSIVTVNPLPSVISGTAAVCTGLTTSLSDATNGGSWTSSNSTAATVGSTGIINGITAGTSVISYILGTGCSTAITVIVNPISTIVGTNATCIGSTTNLSDAVTGGTWSSSNGTVATIGTASGIVSGIASGTSSITYLLSTGCKSTSVVTVNSLPTAITGIGNVCVGSTLTLSDATSSGSWSTSDITMATIGSTGIVTGVGPGIVTITYTLGTGCINTAMVTVNPVPSAITGTTTVCPGSVTSLNNTATGGTWSSSNTTNATVDGSGNVTGVAGGTALITYTMGVSCYATTTVSVSTLLPITGTMSACTGSTTALNDGTTGGTWSSSNPSVGSITTTGVVSGIVNGTTTISYAIASGCTRTTIVAVNSAPAAVSGPSSVCVGYTITFSDAVPGGTWSTNIPSQASVGSATGIVTGNAAGVVTIKYTEGAGCTASATITVNPNVGGISGVTSECQGTNITLSDATTGGTWSSSNTANVTIDGSGNVTALSVGTSMITYMLPTGCYITYPNTVMKNPSAIFGIASVCAGSTTQLSDSTATAVNWTSSNTSIASVVNSGTVTGIASGTATITYKIQAGSCIAKQVVTVNALPAAISGNTPVCAGSTITLSDVAGSGTWSSSNTAIATVGSISGVVTGIAGGNAVIYYTPLGGCTISTTVTVNPILPVSGLGFLCTGTTITLSDATTGGTWSSGNTSVATIGSSSGVVTGIGTGGTSTITYKITGTGCSATTVVTVNQVSGPILGTTTVCTNYTTSLSDATLGGEWSSSNGSVATIGTSGVVTANNLYVAGTATISYALGGCVTTKVITVNATPLPVQGPTSECMGATVSLSDVNTGGTWSTSNSNASIDGSGNITALAIGASTVTYTLSTGCYIIYPNTIHPNPSAIFGTTTVCAGSVTQLSDTTATTVNWTSRNAAVATVINNGAVTGIAAGTATITYKILIGSCITTKVVTVNPIPSNIAGNTLICQGSTSTLSDATTGGTWSSTNTSVATISSAGVVTSSTGGTAAIIYTIGTGCTNSAIVTVNPIASISGNTPICNGQSITLSDAAAGGNWSFSNSAIGTIDPITGIVTSVSIGTARITYLMSTGCNATTTITVNPTISNITGTSIICSNANTVLSDATPGGSWTSSDVTIGTVNPVSGVVAGISAGTVNITYSIGSGCIANNIVTMMPSPANISGTSSICAGLTTSLSDIVSDGTWSSNDAAIAYVSINNGLVTGIAGGTTNISYTTSNGCFSTLIVTVNPLVSTITGITTLCAGGTNSLADTATGGTWSSSDNTIATVGSTGIVTGVAGGYATITYTLNTGCSNTFSVVVNPNAGTISGLTSVDIDSTISLTSNIGGGIWSSSNSNVTINSSGVLTGAFAGTSTISYSVTNVCGTAVATTIVTVNVGPNRVIVSGSGTYCGSNTITASNGGDGTIYYQGTNAVGTSTLTSSTSQVVSSSGTYYFRAQSATGVWGAIGSATVTINPLPANITGTAIVCAVLTTSLTDATSGGTWSSSDISTATIGSTGIVTGVAANTANITYTLPTGCVASKTITVNGLPSVINGSTSVCVSSTTSLSNSTNGGTWSSASPAIATIGSNGILTSIAQGTTTISYTLPTGCYVKTIATINPSPSNISGAPTVCVGLTTTLTDATPGGIWSSSNIATATVGSTGIATGITANTVGITYTLPTGCSASSTITINGLPSTINGSPNVCIGSSAALSNSTSGGIWSSGYTTVATIGTSGIVTGISAGSAYITYTLATGCISTANITINALPATVTASGGGTFCGSTTITATNGGSGTIYFQGNTSGGIATNIPATSQIVYSSGTYYFRAFSSSGCWGNEGSVTVTVNPYPSTIAGTITVCSGLTTSLTDATVGGTWSSSNTNASVDGSGNVTGANAGTANITYTLPTGCATTSVITVYGLPTPINGSLSVCSGSTISLSSSTAGGTWTSTATGVATIGSISGIAIAATAGTTGITYALSTGCIATANITVNALPATVTTSGGGVFCGSTTITASNGGDGTIYFQGMTSGGTSTAKPLASQSISTSGTYYFRAMSSSGCWGTEGSVTVTINPLPATITGAQTVCLGSSIILSDATAGGTWSSNNGSVAPIGSASGIINGAGTGTATITYTLNTGCSVFDTITVNQTPANITGTTVICLGATTTLSDITPSGTWSSGNTYVATVNSAGLVTSQVSGNANITYTITNGCNAITNVTINPLPSAIIGTTAICMGSTSALSNAISGGNWTSTNNSVATIDAYGNVTSVSTGTSNITYSLPTGCNASNTITVNAMPATITGNANICTGSTSVLSDLSNGGSWSSAATGIASVGSGSGIVTGVAAGTVNISYGYATGCIAVYPVTINQSPSAITGNTQVCIGSTTTLSNSIAGGLWSNTGGTGTAILGSTAIITGTGTGTVNIAYTMISGCATTTVVTVNPWAAITGSTPMCAGNTISLSDIVTGGSWNSSNINVATISTSGVVTGTGQGYATISYSLPTGCFATTTVTTNPIPANIIGSTSTCTGLSISLTDATSGGTWVSNDITIATVGSTGIATGVSTIGGSTTISYILGTGCYTTTALTVDAISAIQNVSTVCVGSTITLSDTYAGGSWSTNNILIGTISTSGVVTGTSGGTAMITYTMPGGCSTKAVVTVNPLPTAITGNTTICIGATSTLTDAGGGTWYSSNTSVATIGSSSAIITGMSPGTSGITYTLPTGCMAMAITSVNQPPTSINGNAIMCAGSVTVLNNAVAGGSWSSNNTAIATVGVTSGIVTGIAGGTATITYTMATNCWVTTIVTVDAIQPITGTLSACLGSTTALSNASTGGTWSSSNPSIGSIGAASGIVTGIAMGTVTISYAIPSGCIRTATVAINALPAAISGTSSVCIGSTITLSNTTTGGTWSCSPAYYASIGSTTGTVTGLNTGTANIVYTAGAGCTVSKTVSVNPTPLPIQGSTSECMGVTTSLSNATAGGAWSSSNANASIDGSGNITGIAVGTSTTSYTLPTGCYITYPNTILKNPSAIFGTLTVCAGTYTQLSDSSATSVSWTSSNTLVATAANSGTITGITSGTATITYTVLTGCITTKVVTVNPTPALVNGNMPICQGSNIALTDATSGGIWTSNNTSIATIGSGTGIVASLIGGTTTISYTTPNGCKTTTVVTVNPVHAISGNTNACVGTTTILSDAITGGTWSSLNPGVATVGSSSGLVTGVSSGSTNITYTHNTGCTITTTVNIGPMSPITGARAVCNNYTTLLADATPGGTWSSNNILVATIGTSGLVTASTTYVTGTATISYVIGSCAITQIVTVNLTPLPIQGKTSECLGTTALLSDATSGGAWSVNNTNAAIDGSGNLTAIAIGNSTVSYTMPTGCFTTYPNTILPNPSAMFGTATICAGSTTELSDSTANATSWTSSNTSVATTINSGTITGINTGTATITFTAHNGCITTTVVTVNPAANAGAISGTMTVAAGANVTLTDAVAGGTWSSSNNPIATVGSSTGVVTGASVGNVTISYHITNSYGCSATTTSPFTVSASAPHSAATNTVTICIGSSATLNDVSPGGNWSSNNNNIAFVDNNGMVTGISAGNATISYTLVSGFGTSITTIPITIAALPGAVNIAANPGTEISIGDMLTLSATLDNGGSDPSFQWSINGVPVSGATSAAYTSNSFSDNDSVTCDVISNGACSGYIASKTIGISVGSLGISTNKPAVGNVSIFPNPNKGTFSIKGNLGTTTNEEVTVEVTDILGQVIYKNKTITQNGMINENISLNGRLDNGMYILNMRSETSNKVFHFIIEK